ncbi:MAG TPA: phage/plasmid primase, P4 family [Pirellulales bacterium]|jgi:putative DNA primase/helicase|nr:phage/plasmid primase, P4 family [Pirellulales bacterium]
MKQVVFNVAPANGKASRLVIASDAAGNEVHRDAINPDKASDRERFLRGLGMIDAEQAKVLSLQLVQTTDQVDAEAERAADEAAEAEYTIAEQGDRPRRRRKPPIPLVAAGQIPPIRQSDGQTDLSNGRRFIRMFGEDVRYVAAWRKWLVFDGKRWAIDEGTRIEALAKQCADAIWKVAAAELEQCDYGMQEAILRFAKYSASNRGILAMLLMARSEPGIAVEVKELNANGWLFNVCNGTLDLQTQRLRSHRREDLITKLCPTIFDPSADCKLWLSGLSKISNGRKSIEGFLRRLAGYSLTGVVRDHVLAFLFGSGANGKSTFLNAMLSTMGTDYATKLSAEVLMQKDGASHPTGLTDLYGMRLAVVIETEEGKRLAESMAKELSGGDAIRARRMRENFWEFQPTHKLWFGTNHRPIIKGTDHAIWRRIKMIPFDAVISDSEAVTDMCERLQTEASGILNWMLLGCGEWQADGLGEPSEVTEATGGYRSEMDSIGAFLRDCCHLTQIATCRASTLYAAYVEWAKAAGEHPISGRRFGMSMTERGLERFTSNGPIYRGIGLLADGTD